MLTTHSRRPRAVIMQHIRTGRIISAPSIAAFVRRARLGRYAQFQFDPVFKGEKLSLHGWGLPHVLNRHLSFKDVFGNRYEGTVCELRKRLSSRVIKCLLRDQPIASLAPADYDYGAVLPVKTHVATEYAVKHKGRVYRGATLKAVGRQAGISHVAVWALTHGQRSVVKGVRFHSVKTRQRRDVVARNLEPVSL